MEPLLVLTKSDLADAANLLALYEPLGVPSVTTRLDPSDREDVSHAPGRGVETVRKAISGRTSVFVGHLGVGKSTFINALVPGAHRAIAGNMLIDDGTVPVYRTDRGGDITYHGFGQIVGYPVFDLESLGIGLREYITRLEEEIGRAHV